MKIKDVSKRLPATKRVDFYPTRMQLRTELIAASPAFLFAPASVAFAAATAGSGAGQGMSPGSSQGTPSQIKTRIRT